MGYVKEAIGRWAFDYWLKQNPTASMSVSMAHEGEAQPYDDDPAAHLQAIKIEPWLFRALHVIGQNLSSSPLIAEKQETVNGQLEWVPSDSGELAGLLAKPNPDHSLDYLLWLLSVSFAGAGNAYLHYDRNEGELWVINPSWMKVVRSKTDGVIGYVASNGGTTVKFEKDDIVHIEYPNPSKDTYGQSPIEVIQQPILQQYYYRRFIKNWFKNNGVPGSTLTTEQNLDDGQRKSIRHEWERMHRGVEKSMRTAILSNGLSYQSVTHTLKDMVVDTLAKNAREEIAAVFGVPPLLLGIIDNANRSNSKEQMRLFYDGTILPYQRIISSAINIQLVGVHFGEDERVRFDNSNQDALQEDQTEKMTRVVSGYKGGILTLNEARERIGLEAVDIGDEFSSHNTIGIDIEGGVARSVVSPSAERAAISQNMTDPSKIIWKRHSSRLTKFERRFESVMRRYFDDQLDRLLSAMKRETMGGKMMSPIGLLLMRKDDHGLPINPNDLEAFFDTATEAVILHQAIGPMSREIVTEAGRNALNDYNIEFVLDFKRPEFEVMLQRFGNRSVLINDETYNRLKDILREHYELGSGIDLIEKDLRKYYTNNAPAKARRVARTEMNGLVNGATREAWKQSGVVKRKQWLTSRDGDVRIEHEIADGEIVDIKAPFINTGEPLQEPGDPGGSAWNVINCRCAMAPLIE